MAHLTKYVFAVNIAHTLSDIHPQVNHFLLYFSVIYAKIDQIVQDIWKTHTLSATLNQCPGR